MIRPTRVLLAAIMAGQLSGCRTEEPRQAVGQVLDVARERAAYLEWLTESPVSPLRATARIDLPDTVLLGPPHADVPLEGVIEHRLIRGPGVVTLESDSSRRMIAPYVPVVIAGYSLSVQGRRDHPVVMVFGPVNDRATPPEYYPIDAGLAFEVELQRGKRRATPMLALDGIEVEGTIVGSVTVPFGEGGTRLEVRHVPDPGTEESALEIYFRDETNDAGTYPSGRFVALEPVSGDRYLLDFNRARSPFCAYSTIYPCPVPWRGNSIAGRIEAGEKYAATID